MPSLLFNWMPWANVRRTYLTLLVLYKMSLCAATWCLFKEFNVLCFHQQYTKSSRLCRLLSRFNFFLLKSSNQHLLPYFPPHLFPTYCTSLQAKIILHLVFAEPQSFPFQNITWHLPTGSVEARPIVSPRSLFHLIAIGRQLFPIGLTVCGLGSRRMKETVFQG